VIASSALASASATQSAAASPGAITPAPLASSASLHDQLPASIQSAGVVVVGSEVDYPPMEMFAPDGTTIEGADYDLAQAIGQLIGVKFKFVNNAFSGLIPGLTAGRFDMDMSAMTDKRSREEVVNFVDYFAVGTGIVVKAGNPLHIQGLLDLCGKQVALPAATIQVDIANAEQPKCKAAGRPDIIIKQVPTPSDGFVQIESGASVANMVDYPVAAYFAKTSHGKLEALNTQVGQILPYGMAFRKDETQLMGVVQQALHQLVQNGTYSSILAKWGVSAGAIPLSKMIVNGAIS
jgi:polar amino acid transport system substrate-binding protein